MRSLKPVEKL